MLVPRRVGDLHRDAVWDRCRANWMMTFPELDIVEGHHDVGPFNRSAAVNAAAQAAGEWDVAVVIDADVQTASHPVRKTIEIAHATGGLVIGFDERHHISEAATQKWLADEAIDLHDHVTHVDLSVWSGLVGVSRQLWDAVGGFDEAFIGYGFEDIAFVFDCWVAMGEPHVAVSNILYHLWHPPAAPPVDDVNYVLNSDRCQLYREAAAQATGVPL
jgi:hypothetical protein